MGAWKYLLLCILLINAFLAFQSHLFTPFPLVGDQYAHISLAQATLENKAIPTHTPNVISSPPFTDLEPGYHLLLAAFLITTPGDPVLFHQYYTIIFSLINSLLLFILLKKINTQTALFGTLFFGVIQSDGFFQMHQYFLPLTVGVTLLFLLVLTYQEWLQAKRYKTFIFLTLLFIVALATYAPAAIFFAFVTTAHFLTAKTKEIKELLEPKYLVIVGSASVAVIAGLCYALFFNIDLLTKLQFDKYWSVTITNFSAFAYTGVIPFFLAIVGLWYAKQHKYYLWWIFISLIPLVMYLLFEFSIFIPYKRAVIFYLVGIAIFGGIGANALCKKHPKAIYVLILLLIIPVFLAYSPLPSNILDQDLYDALKATNTQETQLVILNPLKAYAVYPLTGNVVTALVEGNIHGGFPSAVQEYLMSDCPKQLLGLQYIQDKRQKIHLLVTEEPWTCANVTPIYQNSYYLYNLTDHEFSTIN